MNVDAIFFVACSAWIAIAYFGLLFWAVKTKQFQDIEQVRDKPLEEDE
jgi:nitrogen fixation-related uncharacterized protein